MMQRKIFFYFQRKSNISVKLYYRLRNGFSFVIDLVTTKEEIHFTVLRNLRPIYQRDICTENIKKDE